MQLDRGFSRTERRPRKDGQTQIDHRGIQGKNGVQSLLAWQRCFRVKPPGDADQMRCEIGINPPLASGVGMRQGVASNARGTEAQTIKLGTLRLQTGFDIARALTPSGLRERQAAESWQEKCLIFRSPS